MKTFKEYLSEMSTAAVNTTGPAVAGNPKPLMGAPVYKIPHKSYVKLASGKVKGERWKKLIDDVELTSELKKRLYARKPTVLQCCEYPTNHIFLGMKKK